MSTDFTEIRNQFILNSMTKTTLLFASAAMFLACNNSPKQEQGNTQDSVSSTQNTESENTSTNSNAKFDIESIPVTTTDIGTFPYFTLPKGLKSMNKPFQKEFDVCFFPINGIMTPFEGKLYKINVEAERGEEFSKRYYEKSLEDYLQSTGAVKVFDGTIGREEYDRYNKQDPNKGDEGDMGYADENIKFYVIRTKDQGNIYIQFSANNAGGKLNILQEATMTQTITKITADEIAKDLNEKGKSILYINFDTDKSNLTTDGKEVVQQIATALKKESGLTINIEGHTDNTGDATHNKKLSGERANAVLSALTADDIDKSRLKAQGFGAERPLVANDSEGNKAKNRRVELVKSN
ncbi:OmpA family protein [Sphingobacterium yanglingense]|uniref:OmpA family protein n=2 Tax=Sphingobacterium yanglingense TaxID=1437280 RepID=A0A4R6WG34_9SPHI|nr:OmpA family protein [Sphingobacterium yanglingense]